MMTSIKEAQTLIAEALDLTRRANTKLERAFVMLNPDPMPTAEKDKRLQAKNPDVQVGTRRKKAVVIKIRDRRGT